MLIFFIDHILIVSLNNDKVSFRKSDVSSRWIYKSIFYKELVTKCTPIFNQLASDSRALLNPNESIRSKMSSLFETIRLFLYNSLISLIPIEPIYEVSNRRKVNFNAIIHEMERKYGQNIFLKKFLETQMFNLFLDEFYMSHNG